MYAKKSEDVEIKLARKKERTLQESVQEKQQGTRQKVNKKGSKNLGKKYRTQVAKTRHQACEECNNILGKKVCRKIARNVARGNTKQHGTTRGSMQVAGKQVKKYAIKVARNQKITYSKGLGKKSTEKREELG